VDPENDRLILAFSRSVDIEGPPLLFRLEVGEVTVDPRFSRKNNRRKRKNAEAYGETHNVFSTVQIWHQPFAICQRNTQ
jgi:hypothetical protein